MKIEEKAMLVTADSKPYEFEGRKGVSHKARFNIRGEIYRVKATEAQILALQGHFGEQGEVTLKVTSVREQLGCELVDFSVDQ